MTALEKNIVELFETHDMSVEEISVEEGLELEVVKSIIALHSSEASKGPELNIGKEEIKDYIEAYKNLRYSDEAHIQERVLRNLINFGTKVTDGLGANDPKKVAAILGKMNRGVNVLELNKVLSEIRQLRNSESPPKQICDSVIDVESSKVA